MPIAAHLTGHRTGHELVPNSLDHPAEYIRPTTLKVLQYSMAPLVSLQLAADGVQSS